MLGKVVTDMNSKRCYDLFVIIVVHILLLPFWVLLWVVIPLAIWLEDRGPIFFEQQRAGKDLKNFRAIKFRSMKAGADKQGLVTHNEDDRITKFGRFLRRTALDELPQVINILRGEMSFVGPRALPTQMHENETMTEPRFPKRLEVLPGLTGIAQLYLPRHCHPKRRLRYDLLYIDKASIWLDVRLMLLAAWTTLTVSWGTGDKKVAQDTNEIHTHIPNRG
jgi:lipopolysaccharide/colanic/teichoic acid biosynthesis glycosyltransferase